jgi:hypothetical protein
MTHPLEVSRESAGLLLSHGPRSGGGGDYAGIVRARGKRRRRRRRRRRIRGAAMGGDRACLHHRDLATAKKGLLKVPRRRREG